VLVSQGRSQLFSFRAPQQFLSKKARLVGAVLAAFVPTRSLIKSHVEIGA